MGYSVSWIAVRGKSPEIVLAELELRPTGRTVDFPDARSPFCWSELDRRWVVVLAAPPMEVKIAAPEASNAIARSQRIKKSTMAILSHHDERFIDETGAADRFLSSLSAGCEVVGCFVEEHVMVSRATAWKDGVQQWSAKHDAQLELDHLEVVGEPPPSLAEIEAAAREKKQASPDGPDFLFDVPADVAKSVTSFRHDEAECAFEVLEPARKTELTPNRKRSLFGGLFGR
jgi:hypothetical protein